MSKSAAERQAACRKKRAAAGKDGNGQRRLNTWLDTRTFLALARLARHHGVSQAEMLARLIEPADDAILAGLALESPEWDQYFGFDTKLAA